MKKMKKNKQRKKTVVKFHYGFLRGIIVRCKKMRAVRIGFLFRSEHIPVSTALLCFFVIVGISFYPFIIASYKEVLQERISVAIYFLLTASILWQIFLFLYVGTTHDNRCIVHKRKGQLNGHKTHQNDRRYIDVHRKII